MGKERLVLNGLNKKLILGVILLATFLSVLSFVSADAKIEADNVSVCFPLPGCGGYMNKNFTMNFTINTHYYDQNWTSANLYLLGGGSTANNTLYLVNGSAVEGVLNVMLNYTNNATISMNSSWFEDGTDYTLILNLFNGSDYVNKTITPSRLDNTIPQAPSSMTPLDLATLTTASTQTFTSTVVNANTTSCTYTLYRAGSPSDGNSGSGTYSGSTCSFTKDFSSSADNGVWYSTITASDGTNTTASSTNKLTVNIPGLGGRTPAPEGILSGDTGKTIGWIVAVIVVLGLIVGIVVVVNKK